MAYRPTGTFSRILPASAAAPVVAASIFGTGTSRFGSQADNVSITASAHGHTNLPATQALTVPRRLITPVMLYLATSELLRHPQNNMPSPAVRVDLDQNMACLWAYRSKQAMD
jgi:hypothetical protein